VQFESTKFQQFPFLASRPTREQSMRLVRQLQQFDAFFNVVAVGHLVRLCVAHDPALLGTKLTSLAVEELVVDPAIQLVHVHGVDPILKAPVLTLEFRDRLFVELLLVLVAFAQCRPDLLLTIQAPGWRRFVLLDAKYHSSWANVLDAMTSAHVYRDSLRIGEQRPEAALLLLPAGGNAKEWEEPDFQRDHQVGVAVLTSGVKPSLPGLITVSESMDTRMRRPSAPSRYVHAAHVVR
jgi:hypothetical protein